MIERIQRPSIPDHIDRRLSNYIFDKLDEAITEINALKGELNAQIDDFHAFVKDIEENSGYNRRSQTDRGGRMTDSLDEKLQRILNELYHWGWEQNTSGDYSPDTMTIAKAHETIKTLIDQQKQELLDALTIERQQPKRPYGKDDGVKLLCVGFNNCVDALEARKQKLKESL